MIKNDYELVFEYSGDFSTVETINRYCKTDKKLWDDLGVYEIFQDIDGDPEGCIDILTNVSINGELWEFTMEVTERSSCIDYSCYGKYDIEEVKIYDKIKL